MNTNGQINWHTKLRVSAGFCILLGVLRIISCFISFSLTQPFAFGLDEPLLSGAHMSIFLGVVAIIIFTSTWQIFAGIYGVRRWGEPKKSASVAAIAGVLALFDGVFIIGVFVLWIQQGLFSMETQLPTVLLMPLTLIFVGSIAVFMYTHSAYTYALQIRAKRENSTLETGK